MLSTSSVPFLIDYKEKFGLNQRCSLLLHSMKFLDYFFVNYELEALVVIFVDLQVLTGNAKRLNIQGLLVQFQISHLAASNLIIYKVNFSNQSSIQTKQQQRNKKKSIKKFKKKQERM